MTLRMPKNTDSLHARRNMNQQRINQYLKEVDRFRRFS